MTLEWTDPGNASITGWEYRKRRDDGRWEGWTLMGGGGDLTAHPLGGLANGVRYFFRVRAHNDRGRGLASATVSAMPTAVEATARHSAVTLRWLALNVPGRRWEFRVKRAETRKWGNWIRLENDQNEATSGGALVYTVRGLENGVKYRFKVHAVKGAQRTAFGEVNATPEASLPRPLSRPTGTAVSGSQQVEVSWPAATETGVSGYDLQGQSKPVGAGAWPGGWTALVSHGPGTVDGDRRLHVHASLDPDRVYRYRLRSRREAEGSLWSALLPGADGVQPRPGPATGVTSTAGPGDGQVTLRWTGPTHTHITLWEYLTGTISGAQTTWATTWQAASHTATSRQHRVEKLRNGTAYTFQMRARNAAGPGPASAATPAVTPVATLTATFAAAAYEAREGGAAVEVSVNLSPAADRAVSLPITVTPASGAAAGDYTVSRDTLAFAVGEASQSFTITATEDQQAETGETLQLSFGALPAQVQAGTPAQATVQLLEPENRPPVVTGPATPSVAESVTDNGSSTKVATYTASDPDGDALTWSVSEDRHFELKDLNPPEAGKQELHFQYIPDHESRSSYSVDVVVEDTGGLADTVAVSVSVTDVDEPGFVTLTPSSPRVGQTVTATLIDTDGGVRELRWNWKRLGGIQGQSYSVRTESLKVWPGDVGRRLAVLVAYTDNHGSGKDAADTTEVVRANTPSAVGSLMASGGDRSVTLTWTAANGNGAPILSYEYKQSSSATWHSLTGSTPRSRKITHLADSTRLNNGTEYSFDVRARNSEGAGPSKTATATPEPPPNRPPTLTCPATASIAENGSAPWVVAPVHGHGPRQRCLGSGLGPQRHPQEFLQDHGHRGPEEPGAHPPAEPRGPGLVRAREDHGDRSGRPQGRADGDGDRGRRERAPDGERVRRRYRRRPARRWAPTPPPIRMSATNSPGRWPVTTPGPSS